MLGSKDVIFLGYSIDAEGTRPPTERISALREYTPRTVTGLRRFLGMINYYRRFLPRTAELSVPWTPDLEQRFYALRNSLVHSTLLAHPILNVPLGLFTDASSTHVGACLQQKVNGHWQPIAFFSKKLNAQQIQWPA